jgi:hypothetical protein
VAPTEFSIRAARAARLAGRLPVLPFVAVMFVVFTSGLVAGGGGGGLGHLRDAAAFLSEHVQLPLAVALVVLVPHPGDGLRHAGGGEVLQRAVHELSGVHAEAAADLEAARAIDDGLDGGPVLEVVKVDVHAARGVVAVSGGCDAARGGATGCSEGRATAGRGRRAGRRRRRLLFLLLLLLRLSLLGVELLRGGL